MDAEHYIKDFQFYYGSHRKALDNCCLLISLIFNLFFHRRLTVSLLLAEVEGG